MRVVKDWVADVTDTDGNVIHAQSRIQVNDKGRLAVFPGKLKAAPTDVYDASDVTYTVVRRPCSCKGDPPKMTLAQLWAQAERQAANAV